MFYHVLFNFLCTLTADSRVSAGTRAHVCAELLVNTAAADYRPARLGGKRHRWRMVVATGRIRPSARGPGPPAPAAARRSIDQRNARAQLKASSKGYGSYRADEDEDEDEDTRTSASAWSGELARSTSASVLVASASAGLSMEGCGVRPCRWVANRGRKTRGVVGREERGDRDGDRKNLFPPAPGHQRKPCIRQQLDRDMGHMAQGPELRKVLLSAQAPLSPCPYAISDIFLCAFHSSFQFLTYLSFFLFRKKFILGPKFSQKSTFHS